MPEIDNFFQNSKFYCSFSPLQMERPDQIFLDFPSGLRAEMKLCVCLYKQPRNCQRQVNQIIMTFATFSVSFHWCYFLTLPSPWEMSQVGKSQRLQVPIAKAMRLVFYYLTGGLKDQCFPRQEMKQRLSSITT